MCTLNVLDYDSFETNETAMDTINASNNATTHITDTNTFCKKCGCQDIKISFRGENGYCKTCFLSILTHKFRATLGKSKSMHPNDSILIDHFGTANSTVLVHLIKANTNESVNKRFRFQCKILYIDDGMVKGQTLEERKLIRNALAKEAENLQLTTYVVPLTESTTDILCERIQSVNMERISMTSNDVAMQKLFNTLESDTAKDELLQQLRRKLIVSTARKLNCNKVFIADTSVDLAIKVLTDVSTGRGCQLSLNVGFSDTRCADVILLRPLRDFTREDVVGYLECCKLIPILDSIKYNQPFPASIKNITRNFVLQLNSEFHNTVSTIYRTSEKLDAKVKEFYNTNMSKETDANTDNNICVLCELTLDPSYMKEKQLSVVQARIFSGLVSTCTECSSNTTSNSLSSYKQLMDKPTEEVNNSHKEHCRCNNTTCISICAQPLQPDIVEKYLCYGCRLIFLNSNQKFNVLPNFLCNKIQEKLQLMNLQKEITDFLL